MHYFIDSTSLCSVVVMLVTSLLPPGMSVCVCERAHCTTEFVQNQCFMKIITLIICFLILYIGLLFKLVQLSTILATTTRGFSEPLNQRKLRLWDQWLLNPFDKYISRSTTGSPRCQNTRGPGKTALL